MSQDRCRFQASSFDQAHQNRRSNRGQIQCCSLYKRYSPIVSLVDCFIAFPRQERLGSSLPHRGFERCFELVSRPRAAAATRSSHHFWNRSGGKCAAGGELAAHQRQCVLETPLVRSVLPCQRGFQHQLAHPMMRQQQAPRTPAAPVPASCCLAPFWVVFISAKLVSIVQRDGYNAAGSKAGGSR